MRGLFSTLATLSCTAFLISCGNGSPLTTRHNTNNSTITANTTQETLEQELRAELAVYQEADLIPATDHLNIGANPALEKLGMELFFSKALSGNFDVACVTCHHPKLAGSDGLGLSIGEAAYNPDLLGPGRWHNWQLSLDPRADGAPNMGRHSPTIFNTALINRTMFQDGRVFVIDEQFQREGKNQAHRTPDSYAHAPDANAGKDLLESASRFPVITAHEMAGFLISLGRTNAEIRDILTWRFRLSPNWVELFRTAFNQPEATANEVVSFENIQTAIASYIRSLTLTNNPWFNYLQGDTNALTDEQKKGALLFYKSADNGGAGCVNCHSSGSFSDESFHNLAVPQFGRGTQLNKEDFGRRIVTLLDQDRYKFKTPSLLNVEMTAPLYAHWRFF